MIANIESLRKQKNLSQDDIAKHLGITRQTFSKLEKGKIEPTLGQAVRLSEILWVSIEQFTESDTQVEVSKKTDWEKYRQIIQYFIENGTTKSWKIPKTKLAKLCYLADFAWYYFNLESMTHLEYRRIQQWPVPDAFFRVIDELENEEAISLTIDGKSHLYSNISFANTSKLSMEEKSLLAKIAKKWKYANVKEIVDFTHEQLPWMICEDKEIIPYGIITQEDPNHVY